MNDILLTGLPRSGTTLMCACLNQLPDCLALAEPMSPPTHGSVEDALKYVSEFLAATRTRVLSEGRALTKTTEQGFDTSNWFEQPGQTGKLRATRAAIGDLVVSKTLRSQFKLIVKHPAFFTALADPLQKLYPLYAIVRHPLAVLASWQTVEIPVNRGRLPLAEAFAADLKATLNEISSPLDRQLVILRWCFEVYGRLPRGRVVRYEDLVTEPEAVLSDFHSGREKIDYEIHVEDPKTRYSNVDFRILARALLPFASDFEPFYPDFRNSIDVYLTSR
jgi:hypothetical protein